MKMFAEHNEVYSKRVGIDRKKSSYRKYRDAYRHLSEFLLKKYHINDMSFRQLNFAFIEAGLANLIETKS
jgi:hypothetical protein